MIEGANRERLVELIGRLEKTDDSQWCVDVCRTKGGDRNCVMGHVFAMGGEDRKLSNQWWNWFEDFVATTYMIYPVNDGEHPGYKQDTPKARILSYLNDVLEGKRKTTWELDN